MNRLKELRELNGIKQADLAKKLNVSQGTLSNWEQERYDIDNQNLKILADYFNTSIDYLLCHTDTSDSLTTSDNNRIKELRIKKGLSQTDLAKAVNVHQTAISQWETNKTNPDMSSALILADYFNVTTDYLLGRDIAIINSKEDSEVNLASLPKISGINENGEYVSEFSEKETLEIIKDLSNLPDEAMGDLKIMFEVLDAKYNKGK